MDKGYSVYKFYIVVSITSTFFANLDILPKSVFLETIFSHSCTSPSIHTTKTLTYKTYPHPASTFRTFYIKQLQDFRYISRGEISRFPSITKGTPTQLHKLIHGSIFLWIFAIDSISGSCFYMKFSFCVW